MIAALLGIYIAGSALSETDIAIIKLREMYYSASNNKDSADVFLNMMEEIEVDNTPLLLGYKGMAFMLKAKFARNPYSKFRKFTKGKNMLEEAIVSESGNLELRFLRFSAQTNAPGFLGYNDNLTEDKIMLLEGWKMIRDKDLKVRIRNYAINSNYFNNKEKELFK